MVYSCSLMSRALTGDTPESGDWNHLEAPLISGSWLNWLKTGFNWECHLEGLHGASHSMAVGF